MELVILKASDAPEIARLARRYYSEGFQMPVESIASNFTDLESDDVNFCFGLKEEGRLRGYLIAWLSNTLIEGVTEDVALLEDCVIETTTRGRLFVLIGALVQAIEDQGFQGMPIEGAVRGLISRVFLGHQEVFLKRWNYALTATNHYHDPDIGEDFVWVRFEHQGGPLG